MNGLNQQPSTLNHQASLRPSSLVPTDARGIAFDVLRQYHESPEFVAPLLEERFVAGRLPAADRRLATELVCGVIRRLATLDALVELHVSRPRQHVESELWTLLRLGTYQLTFLSTVPPHAAVNETVETARRFGKPRWTGLLNGVLRAVSRTVTDELTNAPAADAIPLTEGRYRLCRQPVFADPVDDPLEFFSRAFSFPHWLAERWLLRIQIDELLRLGFWFNAPAKLSLRVNTLKTSRETMLESLRAADVAATGGKLSESIALKDRARVEELPGFAEGWFSVQDESATSAVNLLSPRPGEMVLDLCAAPGVKTTHLAERMQNDGRVLATDVNTERLARLEQNYHRLGITIVETTLIDRSSENVPAGPFDAILIDAPCSNTGVLGKRPEGRWRIRPQDIEELAALQNRLLGVACDRLKPAGRLVYCTCSIEPEENQQVIRCVLRRRPELVLQKEIVHVPGRSADGGYQALLVRNHA